MWVSQSTNRSPGCTLWCREGAPPLPLPVEKSICSARIKLLQLAIWMGDRLEDTEYLPAMVLYLMNDSESSAWLERQNSGDGCGWLNMQLPMARFDSFWWLSNLQCIYITNWGLLKGVFGEECGWFNSMHLPMTRFESFNSWVIFPYI